MTDLEMTRLCAEAMDLKTYESVGTLKTASFIPIFEDVEDKYSWIEMASDYDPLHDDAQAMALVKKFKLMLLWATSSFTGKDTWVASRPGHEEFGVTVFHDPDLNRAIVECVAKMQQAKAVHS